MTDEDAKLVHSYKPAKSYWQVRRAQSEKFIFEDDIEYVGRDAAMRKAMELVNDTEFTVVKKVEYYCKIMTTTDAEKGDKMGLDGIRLGVGKWFFEHAEDEGRYRPIQIDGSWWVSYQGKSCEFATEDECKKWLLHVSGGDITFPSDITFVH